jgi:hypothetical protein
VGELEAHRDDTDRGNLLLFALLGLEARARVLDRVLGSVAAEEQGPPMVDGAWLDALLGVVAVRSNLQHLIARALDEAPPRAPEPAARARWSRDVMR